MSDEKKRLVDTVATKNDKNAIRDGGDDNDIANKPLLKLLAENVTVEPMMFSYLLASILVILTNQNLNIQKACRVELQLGSEVCTALENKDKLTAASDTADSEIAVQKLVADMLVWQTVVQNAVPAVLVLFLGSWSDRNRLRRPCMLLPIYGEMVKNVVLLVCVYYFDEIGMSLTGLFQSLPMALTGYWTVMFMAVMSYIGDISTDKNKTLRIGMVNGTTALCLPIGTAISGILYRKLGFAGVYIISLILCCISVWMAHVCVHDTKRIKSDKEHDKTYWTRIAYFFNLKHLINAFQVTFKKAENNRRMKVIALTLLITGVMGTLQGEKGVAYLFTRVKFSWNEVQYSVFSSTTLCVNLIGTFFVIGVVVRKFGVNDALIGTVACTMKFLSQFVFAFANTETMFYLGIPVNCLQGPAIISMKSIISKIIPADELGQVSAVTSIGENVIPVVCGPLYSYVYETTVSYFPGAYFLVTAALTVPTIFLYLWLYFQYRKETRESYGYDVEKKTEKNGYVHSDSSTATSANYQTIKS